MKVKVGDTWYDADDQFLAVQFTAEELELVKEIDPVNSNRRFAAGHSDQDSDLLAWLRAE